LAAKKVEHEEIYQKRQAVGEKLVKLRDEEKAIIAKLDNMRSGEGTADGVAPSQKVIDLMDQKQKLIGECRTTDPLCLVVFRKLHSWISHYYVCPYFLAYLYTHRARSNIQKICHLKTSIRQFPVLLQRTCLLHRALRLQHEMQTCS
jgi:hypothetical protein